MLINYIFFYYFPFRRKTGDLFSYHSDERQPKQKITNFNIKNSDFYLSLEIYHICTCALKFWLIFLFILFSNVDYFYLVLL